MAARLTQTFERVRRYACSPGAMWMKNRTKQWQIARLANSYAGSEECGCEDEGERQTTYVATALL
jgi:hypothetical protein